MQGVQSLNLSLFHQVFTLAWTPEGRRLITGASSGEFTLWNGLTFNFETILQVPLAQSCYHFSPETFTIAHYSDPKVRIRKKNAT